MSLPFLSTIAAMAVFFLAALIAWARHHRARPIVWGLGLMLIPWGLWLLGLTDLAVNGVLSLIDWAQRTAWDNMMSWGAGFVGAGIVLVLIALFLPKGPKPQSAPANASSPASAGARPNTYPSSRAVPQGGNEDTVVLSKEDQEIEELLRNRGIM